MPDPTSGIDTVDPRTTSPTLPPTSKTYDLSLPILSLPNNLSLRHHRHSDAPAISHHASNPKTARNMSNRWPTPYTVDKAHDWITTCRNESDWRQIGPTDPKSNNTSGLGQKLPTAWVITSNDEVIGGIGFVFKGDVHARTMRFGYWLGEEHWRKGIMSVVLPAVIGWIWETYPWIVKLEPGAYAWNRASTRLLEKCGFVEEGRLRCSIEKSGVLGDLVLFGLIRDGVVCSGEAPVVE